MVDDSGHVRLTDLEYAKPMDDENIPELKVVRLFLDRIIYESLTTIGYCSRVQPPSYPRR